MAITKRVSGALDDGATKRVASHSVDKAIYDAWGNSWGTHGDSAWNGHWLIFQSLAALGHTARLAAPPVTNITKRITEPVV